jgi:hypothetical protein
MVPLDVGPLWEAKITNENAKEGEQKSRVKEREEVFDFCQ